MQLFDAHKIPSVGVLLILYLRVGRTRLFCVIWSFATFTPELENRGALSLIKSYLSLSSRIRILFLLP